MFRQKKAPWLNRGFFESLRLTNLSEQLIQTGFSIAIEHPRVVFIEQRILNPRISIVASPMDTVCGFEMAYKMAELGGVGCIHRFMSIDEQRAIVKKLYTAIHHDTIVEPSIAEAWGVMYDDWHGEINHVPIMAAIGVQRTKT